LVFFRLNIASQESKPFSGGFEVFSAEFSQPHARGCSSELEVQAASASVWQQQRWN
jgi:hypothetical protein